MVNYNNTLIYKIVHNENVECEVYIGHTTDFRKRKNHHKTTCNNKTGINSHSHYKIYEYIRENGGWDCFVMCEVEKYPCNSKSEAREREKYWFNQFNPTLNNKKAFITEDEVKEYYLSYPQVNREKRREWEKKNYTKNEKTIVNYHKEWYLNNKNRLTEKVVCECSLYINRSCLPRHRKTQRHLSMLNPTNIT
jgi:hypothetical protein